MNDIKAELIFALWIEGDKEAAYLEYKESGMNAIELKTELVDAVQFPVLNIIDLLAYFLHMET